MSRFNFTVADDTGLEDLTRDTKRSSKADVVRDALAVYQMLAKRVGKGQRIFIGANKESATELTITSLEALSERSRPR